MKIIKLNIFILLLIFPLMVEAIIKPNNSFYVNDSANILLNKTEEYIIKNSQFLYRNNGSQIVVVTINSLDNMTLEEYANTLFNEWGIGNKNKNNGVLILLVLEERKSRIEIGNGLEKIFTNEKTSEYQDKYLIPYLNRDKYDEGILAIYNVFYNEILKLNNDKECNYVSITNEDLPKVIFYYTIEIILASYIGYSIYKRKKYNIIKIVILILTIIPYCIYVINNYKNCIKPYNIIFINVGFIILGYLVFNKDFLAFFAKFISILPPRIKHNSYNNQKELGGGGHSSGSGSSKDY